ncbi:MAG: acyl-CoA dehydrogenase family protein [Chrysiogenetes bacterium]|nr:acyl-CoA dehydrogenase family protein [Chrysiogenetes bacterium]
MEFALDQRSKGMLRMLAGIGESMFRPLGMEYDRKGEAIPPDHPFFQNVIDMGLVRPFALEKADSEKEERRGPKTGGRMAVLFAEEASYWDRGVTVTFPGPGLGGPPILKMGTPEQRERFLGPFADKKPRWGCFGMTEPGAGSDVARIATTCRKDGDHYVLNGAKTFISNADRADWTIIFATIDKDAGRAGHRAFVVERGTPGFEIVRPEAKMGLKPYQSCALTLDECRVPVENLLGGEAYYEQNTGFKGAMAAFNSSRALVAVMAIGVGRAAFDYARKFMKDNYELSRPIPRYRRMQEELMNIKRKLDTGRLLAWRGAWLLDAEKHNALEASMAKAYCPPVALEACRKAVEILGDAGVRNDHYVEKLYRDVKAMDIVEGTQQIQRTVIARRLVNLPSYDGR